MNKPQVWIITGSSRGLGHAPPRSAVLASGHQLVATARDKGALAGLVGKYGEQVRAVALDVTDEAAANAAIETAIDTFGRIDVLVNNAGYGNVQPIEDTTLARVSGPDRNQSVRHDHHDEGGDPAHAAAEVGAHPAVFLGRRANRLGRARTLFRGEVGRGRVFGSAGEGSGPVRCESDDRRAGRIPHRLRGRFDVDSCGAPEYDATVGAVARFQQAYNGAQPGDPAKAAAALLEITSVPEPPLRLLLGSDAVAAVETGRSGHV